MFSKQLHTNINQRKFELSEHERGVRWVLWQKKGWTYIDVQMTQQMDELTLRHSQLGEERDRLYLL